MKLSPSRTLFVLCCTSLLAIGLGGCAANIQADCVQPPLQTYPTPQMLWPISGQALPASGKQDVFVAYPLPLVGIFSLVSAQGTTVGLPLNKPHDKLPAGAGTPQPGYTQLTELFVGTAIQPHNSYAVTYSIPYKLGCNGGNTTKTQTIGTFTT